MNPQTTQPQTPDWSQAYPASVPVQAPQSYGSPHSQMSSAEQQPTPHTMLPTPVSMMSSQGVGTTSSYPPQNAYVAIGQHVGPGSGSAPMPELTTSPLPTQQTPAHASAPQTSPSVQDEASDSVLDEEWVEKAKQIILRTKGDPYAQGQELAKIKAQYIKARYNKDIKMGEI